MSTTSLTTRAGRRAEADRLLDFARGSLPRGEAAFAYLDGHGRPDPRAGHPLWVTARMTHVFALASMLGRPDTTAYAQAGVTALTGAFADSEHGGWFGHLSTGGEVRDAGKSMYEHAFVLLSAATATQAGVRGAADLFADAARIVDTYFWEEPAAACRESWDRAWTSPEEYRGANSNMHAVEAFLAAASVSGDAVWVTRALRIAERLVHQEAARRDWRLPEHYTAAWEPVAGYNADRPADQFRPYGVTIGHLFEWARLLVHLDAALAHPPAWLLADAARLFGAACQLGWEADGSPGLVYTVGWDDEVVVAERMHWVAVEAVMAASALGERTADPRYAQWESTQWADVERFVDRAAGSWQHELSPSGQPSSSVWTGKPDVYHAFQGMLLPDLPLTGSLAQSVLAAG
jgi:mannose/cellobiose epimerase-like protein (N-acyl-D-glucosamine 2-epimerase family)